MHEAHFAAVFVTDALRHGDTPRKIALMRHTRDPLHEGNLTHLPLWTAMLEPVPHHLSARDRASAALRHVGISVLPRELSSLGGRLAIGEDRFVYPWHLPLRWIDKLDGIVTDDYSRQVRVVTLEEAARLCAQHFWMAPLVERLALARADTEAIA